MYLIHGRQIEPLFSETIHAQSENTFSLAAGCSEVIQAKTTIQNYSPFLYSGSQLWERQGAPLSEIPGTLGGEITVEIKLTQTFAPSLKVSGMISAQRETEEMSHCWPWPSVPARQAAIQHILTGVACLRDKCHKPKSRYGSSSVILPSRVH